MAGAGIAVEAEVPDVDTQLLGTPTHHMQSKPSDPLTLA